MESTEKTVINQLSNELQVTKGVVESLVNQMAATNATVDSLITLINDLV